MSHITSVCGVSLTFKTNVMSAIDITSSIGIEPDSFINAGESVRTTYGTVIKTGLHSWSLWTREFEVEKIGTFYRIEEKVVEIIDACEPRKILIDKILRSGGVAGIQIRLTCNHNIGDTFSPLTLAKICGLGMSLSIEIFDKA